MKTKTDLITLLTNDVRSRVKFYADVLSFAMEFDNESYVNLKNEGVRFSICSRKIMPDATGHEQYKQSPKGQSFELAFPVQSPEQVDAVYGDITATGAQRYALENTYRLFYGAWWIDPLNFCRSQGKITPENRVCLVHVQKEPGGNL